MLSIVFNFSYFNFVPELIIKIKNYEKNYYNNYINSNDN